MKNARFIRGCDPWEQLIDVVRRLRLAEWIRPYTRCTSCNGVLVPARRAEIALRVQPGTLRRQDNRRVRGLRQGVLAGRPPRPHLRLDRGSTGGGTG
ncbi:MAG TPA: Mut7-C RNAse domain-containing protein [Jiangellaceae bacterium]|nr:Mut7-C RNAse domain-containing protein [Jiangellaceae bacterium]